MKFGDNNLIYNDYNHPICYTDFLKDHSILINEDYFNLHKDDILSLVIELIKKHRGKLKISSSCLINDDVINAIIANPNITQVALGTIVDKYVLTKKDYDKLNNGIIKGIDTEAVSDDIKDNFDGIIYYNMTRNLVSRYNYNQFKGASHLYLNDPIKEDEIQYFNIVNNGVKITFSYDDYDNILDTIEKINKFNKNFEYTIKVNDKNKFNKIIFSKNRNLKNVKVMVDAEIYTYDKYYEFEKMLYEMIKPALNLSPFEKFLYAYNIVKHYKLYKESSENVFESRNLYDILINEYMVCVGYAKMLIDLLDKLGIASVKYGLDVDIGFDKVAPNEENVSEDKKSASAGHVRVIVNLVDEKYGINGIYQSDPTWDNILDKDSYVYSLMTFDEALKNKRYLYKDKDITSIFYARNLEEFYNIVNNYMDNIVYKEKNGKYAEDNARSTIVKNIMKVLSGLDNEFYKKLLIKYEGIEKYNAIINDEILSNFMFDVGLFIVSKINNKVNVESYINAIRVLYTSFYGMTNEEIEKLIKETLEYNKKRVDIAFPTTYKIDQNDNKEIYNSIENKFEYKDAAKVTEKKSKFN